MQFRTGLSILQQHSRDSHSLSQRISVNILCQVFLLQLMNHENSFHYIPPYRQTKLRIIYRISNVICVIIFDHMWLYSMLEF